MIKVQIHYTTIDGVKKSKIYSYVNPAASDVTIKDFANALNSLTTNTTGDIYKIDTAILLDDDSDDIVTPIVEDDTGTDTNLLISSNTVNLAYNSVSSTTITATYNGRGTLTATGGTHTSTTVNNKVVTITAAELDDDYTDTVLINVSAAGNYYSDTASITVYGNFSPMHFQEITPPANLATLLGQLAQGNEPEAIFDMIDPSELEGYTYAGHKMLQVHGRYTEFPFNFDLNSLGFSANSDTRLLFILYDFENGEVLDAAVLEAEENETFTVVCSDDDGRLAIVVYQPE